MLLSCGVCSAYGSLIACASLHVWQARFFSLTVFLVPVSLWNPRDVCATVGLAAAGQGGLYACIHCGPSGRCLVRVASMEAWPDLTWPVSVSLWNPSAAVGLAAGQGGPVCMHPSRSLGAVPDPHRIHGFLTWPDLCCPRCVGPMDPVRAGSRLPLHYRRATSPHPMLPYATLTGPTVPCLSLHHAHPPLCFPCLTYISLSLCLCYCSGTRLHCTVQPVMAVTTPAPCSWRRGLTSQLEMG